MQKLSVLFALLSICIMTSCGDDAPVNDGQLKINFALEYDGEPVVLLDEYTYPDGRKINFTRFSFYMSTLELVDAQGPTDLVDVDYIDMSDDLGNKADSERGTDYIITDVNEGDYEQLRMNFGVYPSANAMEPADFPTDNPLSKAGEYWSGWNSYIFVKIEGNADLDNDGTLENLEGISLHIGADETLRPVFIEKQLEIRDGEVEELKLVIDLKDLFIQDGDIYDIEETPQIHSLSQTAKAVLLSQNLGKSISVR